MHPAAELDPEPDPELDPASRPALDPALALDPEPDPSLPVVASLPPSLPESRVADPSTTDASPTAGVPTNPVLKCVTDALAACGSKSDASRSYPLPCAFDQYTASSAGPLYRGSTTTAGIANVRPGGSNS